MGGASKVTKREWMRRLGWLVALWVGGVSTLATVAYVLKKIMHALGMQ